MSLVHGLPAEKVQISGGCGPKGLRIDVPMQCTLYSGSLYVSGFMTAYCTLAKKKLCNRRVAMQQKSIKISR